MLSKHSGVLLLLVSCSIYISCEKEAPPAPPQSIPTVCIWDEASIRSEPSRKATRVSTMALGEKVIWLGNSVVDSSDEDITYLNIKLSDGATGWTSEKLLATDAVPAVVIAQAQVYRRPDLVTETNIGFESMDLIAITKIMGDWIEVVGEKKLKAGWIHTKTVSKTDEDVAVALLAMKAMSEKDEERKIEKIDFILNNSTFSKSSFIPELKKLMKELSNPEVVAGELEVVATEDE
ncbi:MAG: SH3 domain-containing protein [Candidatus Marinimicrobia bacterium]|nr:SH3 domain-containing protein [Candidatus Neomarinimicrobiota bacterium]